MENCITYLGKSFTRSITEFLRHWYVDSTRKYWHLVIDKLERIDYALAWKITLKNLFRPLYKDYTFIGYILGFLFRLGRLALGSIVYILIFTVASAFYVFWLLFPMLLIVRIFTA